MKKKVRKTRRQLQAEKAAIARQLVDNANSSTNLLETLEQFHTYTAKDDCVITLTCARSEDIDTKCWSWIFDIMERNMKYLYEQSDWGWNFDAKKDELTDPMAWYLVASYNGEFVGFSHFRFDIDYGVEVLYCYELQLEASLRRKGLGRFMLLALESIAFQKQMQKVVLTVLKHNPSAVQFFRALGYKLDNTSPSESKQVDYVILSKQKLKCGI